MNISVSDVIEEAKRFESESRSLLFADSRGVANIQWNHSELCKAECSPDTQECTWSRAIFTAQHLEYYEANLTQTEVDPNERAVTSFKTAQVAVVKVKEKKSLDFASKYYGITHGFKPDQHKIRNDQKSSGDPDYISTATLAFTTKHSNAGGDSASREKRALFGEHKCLSGTLRRCYGLIQRMMEVIRKLLKLLNIAGAPVIPALHRDLEDLLLEEEVGGGGGGIGQARRRAVVGRPATAVASAASAAGVSVTFQQAVAVDSLVRDGYFDAPAFTLGGNGGSSNASSGGIASDGISGAPGAAFALGGDNGRSNAFLSAVAVDTLACDGHFRAPAAFVLGGDDGWGSHTSRGGTMEMEASFLPAPAQQESAASAAKTPSRRALRAAPTIDTSPQGDGATPRASRNANFKRRKKCEDEKQAYLQAVRRVHGDGGGKHTEEEVLISNMTNHEAKRMYRAIHKHFPHITLSRDTKRMQNIEERKKLREKRQDPLHCAECAAKYAATGGTQRIFQLCRTFEKAGRAKGVGQAIQMPTSNSLSEWGATLSQAACRDLQFRATPEGLSISMQSTVELMVHQHETTPPPKPRRMRRNGTMKMPAQKTIPAKKSENDRDRSVMHCGFGNGESSRFRWMPVT